MEKKIYDEFKAIVYQKAGIQLGDKKESLVAARVSKRLRELKLDDFRDYLSYLKKDESGEEMIQLIDVISTNVTSFFRESQHFEYLKTQMQVWLERGVRRFRFWSAACSTGEEPYTLAMVLQECAAGYNADIRILATDISTNVLHKAIEGVYPQEKVAGIPSVLLSRYFNEVQVSNRDHYEVSDALKKMIVFRRLNLSEVPFPMKGPMDCVFCRNVMIYFDNEIRRRLLGEIQRLLKPEGILFVGHAESLTGQLCNLKNVKPSVYVK